MSIQTPIQTPLYKRWQMRRETRTRAGIAAIVYTMTNAVMFGAGLIFVLSVPGLRNHAALGILAVVLASLIFAAPAAWLLAPRLRARFWRRRAQQRHSLGSMPHATRT